jgi:hypothetical protein
LVDQSDNHNISQTFGTPPKACFKGLNADECRIINLYFRADKSSQKLCKVLVSVIRKVPSMDQEKYLKELLKWVSSDSLLVIDSKGNLRRIYCPFKVICLVNFPDITKGQKVAVEAVKLTIEIREVYIIRGVAYHIAYFTITLES